MEYLNTALTVFMALAGLVGVLLAFIGKSMVNGQSLTNQRLGVMSEAFAVMATKFEVLTNLVKRIEDDQTETHKRFDKELMLMRKRQHWFVNKLSAIRIKLEVKNIVKFSEENWKFPDEEEATEDSR